MKIRLRTFILAGSLIIILIASLILNYALFKQGQQYYLQLNDLRLDPLGLGYFPNPPAEKSSTPRVIFLGDSRAANWPAPDLAAFEFINRGIGAQTTTQVLARFDAHVIPLHPDFVIIQVGINDLKTIPLFPDRKASIISNCEANIRQLVEKSTSQGATVILTTIFPTASPSLERQLFWSEDVGEAIAQVNTSIRSMQSDKVIIFDSFELLAAENGMIRPDYSFDLLHLNEKGYQRLNHALSKLLLKILYNV